MLDSAHAADIENYWFFFRYVFSNFKQLDEEIEKETEVRIKSGCGGYSYAVFWGTERHWSRFLDARERDTEH